MAFFHEEVYTYIGNKQKKLALAVYLYAHSRTHTMFSNFHTADIQPSVPLVLLLPCVQLRMIVICFAISFPRTPHV